MMAVKVHVSTPALLGSESVMHHVTSGLFQGDFNDNNNGGELIERCAKLAKLHGSEHHVLTVFK